MGSLPGHIVYLVEDDVDARRSLVVLLEGHGLSVQAYARGESLLADLSPESRGCLLLDLVLPGANAIELMQAVREMGCALPFLIITGHGDVPTAVASMQEGAIDYLVKPVDPAKLLQRIERAFDLCDRFCRERQERIRMEAHLATLTPREREVLERVVEGKMTREIAAELGISPKTVEVHRSHVTRKMHVGSVVQLVRLVAQFQLRDDAGAARHSTWTPPLSGTSGEDVPESND